MLQKPFRRLSTRDGELTSCDWIIRIVVMFVAVIQEVLCTKGMYGSRTCQPQRKDEVLLNFLVIDDGVQKSVSKGA